MDRIIIPQAYEGFDFTRSWGDMQRFDWIKAMKDVPQDPVHHAEGDVHIHTGMVLDAMTKDPAWRSLDSYTRSLEYVAAVMHDVAKPLTTDFKINGRIGHPGHSPKGALMARRLLWEMDYPFPFREAICGQVLFHQMPYWLITEDNVEKRLARLTHMARADLLSILARADIKGRVCEDQEGVLENIELFGMLAEEHKCFSKPLEFSDAHTRYSYFRGKCASRHDVVFDDTWGEVIVMCGLPGSGKDTWIKEHAGDLPVISYDDMRRAEGIKHGDKVGTGRIRQEATERAKEFLRAKKPFVWNATNLQRTRRRPLIDMASDYGARVRIVYVEAFHDDTFRQNKDREHTIPEEAIRKMSRSWELPTLIEAQEVEYWVGGMKVESPIWG